MKLLKVLLFIGGSYAALKIVFGPVLGQPLPSSLLTMYMFFIIAGTLIATTFTEEGASELIAPAAALFTDARYGAIRNAVVVAAPVAAGALAYLYMLPDAEAPARLRTIHPAPPAYFSAFGKSFGTDALENPYRKLKTAEPAAFAEAVRQGEAVYFGNCHFCHGARLDGRGQFAASLNPPPTDFTDPGTIAQLKESYLFWRIATGARGLPKGSAPEDSAMPAWQEYLAEDEIWKVIAFLYERTGREPRSWR